jgi:UDP-N-acetylmuramoylalanine--D-glutamate ligase
MIGTACASGTNYDAVIVGMGETGCACVDHLVARGARLAIADTRAAPPAAAQLSAAHPEVEQYVGGLDADLLCSAAMVVLSPGVDPRLPAIRAARDAGVELTGEIELFARTASAPVIAITGSNGKSTVTSLVGALLQHAGWDAAVGGNLGPTALSLIRAPEPDCYVLELSSFQLETVQSLDAAAATVLNITPDHMDRYDTVDDYIAAKRRIYRGHGTMVINADDPVVAAMAERDRSIKRFHAAPPQRDGDAGVRQWRDASWLALGAYPVLPVTDLPLAGAHNKANALAALALGDAMGLSPDVMAAAINSFRGLPHRMELLGEYGGVYWYNDSKATNVGAAVAAVAGLADGFVLIAGGQGKDQAFDALADAMPRARGLVVMGDSAEVIAGVVGDRAPLAYAGDMAEAVTQARGLARPGDTVVLAPACASFDQYTGYAARGDAFRAAVEACGDG